ncbi:MAG: hypothetical protein KBS69_01185 [Bacteroidales bacterium]|nr:hypothetical protein [Candidatus Colicola caccequi]
MKSLNQNLAHLRLLFVMGDNRWIQNSITPPIEYYTSDDGVLMGVICVDRLDGTFGIVVLDYNNLKQYQAVEVYCDIDTIDNARVALNDAMGNYVRDTAQMSQLGKPMDFFAQITSDKELSPLFQKLKSDDFFSSARAAIEEISPYIEDRDGNLVEQLQTVNGFDARIWELYLLCYFREAGLNLDKKYDVPDFVLYKGDERVAVEAVTIQRKQKGYDNSNIPNYTTDEMFQKLENEIPLMFGSSLYSKLKHTYENKCYWELPQCKDLPFVFAIEDFHEDMSMMWTFNGVITMLYGIDQRIEQDNDGNNILINSSGKAIVKESKNGQTEITPLFLDRAFENVSAVLFSATGTLSKFNRMGRQAGLGSKNTILFQTRVSYNKSPNAISPIFSGHIIDENCHETWGDGVNIFHNPLARVPLDSSLFPGVAHHYYKDGMLYSDTPHDYTLSSFTWNIKSEGTIDTNNCKFRFTSPEQFQTVMKQWVMKL